MRRWFYLLLMVGLGFGLWGQTPSSHAQRSEGLCRLATGETLVPRYSNGRVELVSWDSGETVQVLAEGIDGTGFDIRDWSPDCRYLVIGFGPLRNQTVWAWEITPTASRLIGTSAGIDGRENVQWVADNSAVLLKTTPAMRFWNLTTDQQTAVNAEAITRLYWDQTRGHLLGVVIERSGVIALDLGNGPEVALYDLGGRNGGQNGVRYDIDGPLMVVVADHFRAQGAAIWNRDTGWSLQLDIFLRSGVDLTYGFSPDGRYFVLNHGGGNLYIWDLPTLQGQAPYAYTGMVRRPGILGQTMPLRFTTNTTVEGYKIAGGRYNPIFNLELYRFDIAAARQVFYDKFRASACLDGEFLAAYTEADLARWACDNLLP